MAVPVVVEEGAGAHVSPTSGNKGRAPRATPQRVNRTGTILLILCSEIGRAHV